MFSILSFSHLNNFHNANFVPIFPVLTFGTISALHFHHFSTHTTYGILVCVIYDFRRNENHFTAPELRCLEKRADSDCHGIRRNFTC